ncbi:MAG: class I SAM-dependent methyltransferase [Hyphomicrobiaceae bacterium]
MSDTPSTAEYQRWEQRFSVPEYIFGEEPNVFLARQKPLLPSSGKALAVSDGEGRNGVWLAEQGLAVTSFDFSPRAVEKARALAARRGVAIDVSVADIYTYPWPAEVYDVIAVIFIQYMGPAERAQVFAGVRRALKPGGLLLIEGYTPKQIEYGTGGPKEPENMYTRELLEQEFAGFASLRIDEYEVEMHEGGAHGGMSAVIDLVARK